MVVSNEASINFKLNIIGIVDIIFKMQNINNINSHNNNIMITVINNN